MRLPWMLLFGVGTAACGVAEAGVLERSQASGPDPVAPVIYEPGRPHSPITDDIARHLADIAALGPDQDERWFVKVGDSITDTRSYLGCFDGDDADLGDHTDLEDTLAWFRGGERDGTSPFARRSKVAVSGWAARSAIKGSPSPLEQELAATAPRYATVMFGTNDVGYRTADQFGSDLWTITDALIARGIVPVLSTIPPRDDDDEADAKVPLFDLVIRAIAQGRQIPLVDYHDAMAALDDHGLGRDGVHPTRSRLGACTLSDDALTGGYNVRNLLTLEAFDRARRAVAGEAAPDVEVTRRTGTGIHNDPVIATLPFADLGDTSAGENTFDVYGCDAKDEAGPELVYRLDLDAPTTITANVIDPGDLDLDVHILSSLSAGACLDRGDHRATAAVPAGTVYVVVDTYGDTEPGEFVLTIQ